LQIVRSEQPRKRAIIHAAPAPSLACRAVCELVGMAGGSLESPPPAIFITYTSEPRSSSSGDDGGDDGDGDDGGPALGWPLPGRQRRRSRGSFFGAIAWGSHLLNTDVSMKGILSFDGARCRAILVFKRKRIQARMARSGNANRLNHFLSQCSISASDERRISGPRSWGREGNGGVELSLGKTRPRPLNPHPCE
jgi:hypothetical protein